MIQSTGLRKLRSSSNCKFIPKTCLQQLNSEVFDENVKGFLDIRDQINCQQINCQTFRKPKADPQILSGMKQLGVKQQEQANHLISQAKKTETKILAITKQQVEIPKIVKSEQKGKPKQEMFLDDEFNEEYDIMEDPDFHMGE